MFYRKKLPSNEYTLVSVKCNLFNYANSYKNLVGTKNFKSLLIHSFFLTERLKLKLGTKRKNLRINYVQFIYVSR